MSKQDRQELKFTRASFVGFEEFTSLVLEARIDRHQVASLAQINGEWVVFLETHGGVIRVSLDNIGKIITEFAQFIQEYESFTPTGDNDND
jgi:hypothetical protein